MIPRRKFAQIMTAAAASFVISPLKVFSSSLEENAEFVTKYPDIPRIDSHNHIGRSADANIKNYLQLRKNVLAESKVNVALWIDLDGGTKGFADGIKEGGMERLKQFGDTDRMIPSITDWRPAYQISYSPALIESRFKAGYVGYKLHWGADWNDKPQCKHPWINDKYFDPTYKKMDEIKMPLTSWHIEGNWIETGGGKKQLANLKDVMTRYPKLVVVHAHMGVQRWSSLKEQSEVMDKFPNYYRDISVTIQHAYKEDYNELRNFFIKYADRLLYGTDKMEIATTQDLNQITRLYKTQFEFYETSNMILTKYAGKTDENTPEYTKGLNLPKEVLEKIYYKNIVRIYPQLVKNMKTLGFGDLVTAISTIDLNKPQIYVNDGLLIIKGLPEGISGEVYSISGRRVANLPISGYDGELLWNSSEMGLPSGVYIVNLKDANKRNYYSDKFVLSGKR